MKLKIAKYLLLLISLLPVVGCEEPYTVAVKDSEQGILVIEANLSDSSLVRISQTTPLNDTGYQAVSNAQVTAESESGGNPIPFYEIEEGLYYSPESPRIGERYRLTIRSQGVRIQSEWAEMMAAQEIDKLYYEVDAGILRIFLDSRDSGPTGYYRWDFEESWEYNSRYYTNLEYRDGAVVSRPSNDRIYICYKIVDNTQILIGSSVDLAENNIRRQLIHEIDPLQSMRLNVDYSIKVTQYRISPEAFEFWRILKANTETMGSIFDVQPSNLPSNFKVINGEQPVIGFFSATMPAFKRIFIRRIDLPFSLYYDPYKGCSLDSVPSESLTIEDAFGQGDYLPVRRVNGKVLASAKRCVDCRERGGDTEKPPFWIY